MGRVLNPLPRSLQGPAPAFAFPAARRSGARGGTGGPPRTAGEARVMERRAKRGPPVRRLLAAAGVWALAGGAAVPAEQDPFAGERVLHLLEEPRHRTVFAQGGLRLLDVQINPGDVSFPHVHDQAILLTSIHMGDGPRRGAVSVNTDYASEPFTHRVSNAGPGLFRIIALVNEGEGAPDGADDRPVGAGAPDIDNPWFRSWRFELAPGERAARRTHRNASVVVQATEGTVHVSREDGITRELARPGDWAWRGAGAGYVIRNAGAAPVIVVVNEGRGG